jgi:hypothetical protein
MRIEAPGVALPRPAPRTPPWVPVLPLRKRIVFELYPIPGVQVMKSMGPVRVPGGNAVLSLPEPGGSSQARGMREATGPSRTPSVAFQSVTEAPISARESVSGS